MRSSESPQSSTEPSPSSRPMTGRASSAVSPATTTRSTTLQVSAADAVREASARRRGSPEASREDSSGTSTPARAPPATTSNRTLGTWFAVW